MKLSLLSFFLLITIISSHAYSQTKLKKTNPPSSEVLTNASLISLHKAGLDDEVIISKIETSQTNVDLSTNRLIDLKNAGISNTIIKALIDKGSGKKAANVATVLKKDNDVTGSLKLINTPYYLDGSHNTYKPIEKTVSTMRFKNKAFGYGGVDVLYEIEGSKSAIRISPSDTLSFFLNTGGNPLPELVLYRLKVDGDKRSVVSMQTKVFGSAKPSKSMIPYNTQQLGNGIYKLAISEKLPAGEYFFSGKPVTSSTSIEVFAFGIE